MLVAKVQVQDLEKLLKEVRKSNRVAYVNIFTDGPSIKFQFENDQGRLTTVTIFDESKQTAPTASETRSL